MHISICYCQDPVMGTLKSTNKHEQPNISIQLYKTTYMYKYNSIPRRTIWFICKNTNVLPENIKLTSLMPWEMIKFKVLWEGAFAKSQCRIWKTNIDIIKYNVLKSIIVTEKCIVLVVIRYHFINTQVMVMIHHLDRNVIYFSKIIMLRTISIKYLHSWLGL